MPSAGPSRAAKRPVPSMSAEELHELVSSANDLIYTLDLGWNILWVNDAATRILGYTLEEACARTVRDVVAPEYHGVMREKLQAKLEGRDPGPAYEIEMLAKDGRRVAVEISPNVLRQQRGQTIIQGIARDITARKQAEQARLEAERALRAREQHFRVLFEDSVAFICTHKLDGTLLSINPAAAHNLGYPAEAAIGRKIRDFMPPEAQVNFDLYLDNIAEFGRDSGEMWVTARDGKRHTWSYSNVLVHPPEGEPYVIGHAVDVTELRAATDAVRASEQRFRTLFDSSVAFICTHTLDGTILSVNPAAAKALGYPAEYGIGRNLRDFQTPEAQKNFDAYLEALRTEGHHADEAHFRTRDGSERVWHYSNVVVRPEGGEPYVIAHAVDATELTEALGKVQTLTGLLPICSACKKIRDDRGQWNHIESYIRERSQANFSHGICPDCAHRLYPEHYKK